jgi:putative tricarboxylic transport membrane protein
MELIVNMATEGFSNIFNLQCMLLIVGGTAFGAVFGCIPGLTANLAMVIALPFCYSLQPVPALTLLVSIYIGGISGGLIAAVLIGIPGTPASVATVFDGYPMAQKGEAGKALGIGIFYSFLGTLFGFLCLIALAPPLAKIGLMFGFYEFFALIVFSFTIIAALVSGNILKGLGATVMGMALSMIGGSPLDGVMRFHFGTQFLRSGLDLLTLSIGFYAVVALMDEAASKGKKRVKVTANYTM